MAAPDPHHRTQEQSIKARKHQLFDSDEHAEFGPHRSFAECLRETPAAPLSPAIKVILWVVGTLVIAILLLAFVKVGTRKPRGRATPSAAVERRGGTDSPVGSREFASKSGESGGSGHRLPGRQAPGRGLNRAGTLGFPLGIELGWLSGSRFPKRTQRGA